MTKRFKQGVHPGNPQVGYLHYLIGVSNADREMITCYVLDQAYTGRDTLATRMRLYNQVQASLHALSSRTGLRYTLLAWGSRDLCYRTARIQGWTITG